MQLRQRQASDAARAASPSDDELDAHSGPPSGSESSASETSSSDSASSGEEWGVASSRRVAVKKKSERRRGPFRPDLLELVFNELGRTDAFDAKSLAALRLTCKSFKALVDGEGLKNVTLKKKKQMDLLLASPDAVQRMETLTLRGKFNMEVADAMRLMELSPLRLKKISFASAGLAFDVLAFHSFPELTSLELHNVSENSKALKLLGKKHRWPLRELSLSSKCDISALDLAATLARFPELKKLSLHGVSLRRDPAPRDAFSAELYSELEFLRLTEMPGIRRTGLFDTATLPALCHLDLGFSRGYWDHVPNDVPLWDTFVNTLATAPWLSQLEDLRLRNHCSLRSAPNIAPLLRALSNVTTLTKLTLGNWSTGLAFFESIDCPSVVCLEIEIQRDWEFSSITPSLLRNLSNALLPALKSLIIAGLGDPRTRGYDTNRFPKWETLEEMDGALFPRLRSLAISGIVVKPAVVERLAVHVLPTLEEFSFANHPRGEVFTAQKFIAALEEGAPEGAEFASLRKLEFGRGFALVDFLPAAPRFSNLQHLSVDSFHNAPNYPLAELEKFVSDAADMDAWPNLQLLCMHGDTRLSIALRYMAQVWPDAKISAV